MQRGLIVCPPDADLKTIARTMAEASIHCVFVTDILRRNHNRSGGVDGDQTPTFCLGRAAGVEIGVNGPG